jgi:lipopolysaccharide transport system permease protein
MVVGLTLAQRANLVNIGKTDLPYPLYVVLGTALWQLFVDSLNAPVSAFTSSRSMLTKIRFPREAIYVSKVGEVIFDFMMKAFIIAVLFGVYKVIPGISTLLGIFALIPLILFGLALGFLLVPMSVLFQDIVKGTTIATGYLFFLTPIVYPIPDIGVFRTVVSWNPLTPLIVTCRELLTSSDLTYLHGFWVMTAIASCLLILSWAVVYISMPLIIERTSA